MKKKRINLKKILYVAIPVIVAILLFSVTIGHEIYEGKTQSLQSFALVHFSGYLFFLLMPVEMAFVYYLSYYEEAKLIGVALITAISAQIIDYVIGLFFSSKFIRHFVGEKRIKKAEKQIRQFGNLTIFIFNLFPLSSPIIALVAGMLKLRFRDLLLYSLTGLLLKYVALTLIF
jgi:membrane protein DedA with SNARE-associated domain